MIKICRQHLIHRFIFASSSTLYQAPKDLSRLTEFSKLHPINPYGQTKLDCETLIFKNADFLKGYIFRFFNIAGAELSGVRGQDSLQPKHVIDRMSAQIANQNLQVTIFGQNLATPDGTVVRDYIHVFDVVSLLIKAIQKIHSENKIQIFNCGSGIGTSLKQLVSVFAQVTGQDIQIKWGDYHQGDPLYLVSDSYQAKSYFGWSARSSDIFEIVRSAYQWSLKREKY